MPLLFFLILVLLLLSPAIPKPGDAIVLDPEVHSYFVLDPGLFMPENPAQSLWTHQRLGNLPETSYTPKIREDGQPVIFAESHQSASGLVVPISADPKDFPVLEWEWWIESVLENGDLRRRDGDDYAARIYITFDHPSSMLSFRERVRYFAIRTFTSFEVPTRALSYIWANQAEPGTIAPNPYTGWVQMVVVRSGNEDAGSWQSESVNILEDYRRAFGEDPPRITGIQIMTDSDDTGSSARAMYGPITLRSE